MSSTRTVSVIGLGLMGSALADALLAAGHKVTVWNRSRERAAPLEPRGAAVAASAGAAVTASDVTITCVSGHQATMELLVGVKPPVGRRTLVQLATMTPDESQALADWAGGAGMAYLDGSILGLPSTVREGSATLVCSGPRESFDAAEPLLRAFGTPLHLSPEFGAAVTFDRVWYAYAYGVIQSFLQGAAMAHALGFSKQVYFQTVAARTPVILGQLMGFGARIEARDFATSDARLEVWANGFEGVLALCRDTGVDHSLPDAVLGNLRRAIAAGHGDSDMAAVFEVLIGRDAA